MAQWNNIGKNKPPSRRPVQNVQESYLLQTVIVVRRRNISWRIVTTVSRNVWMTTWQKR